MNGKILQYAPSGNHSHKATGSLTLNGVNNGRYYYSIEGGIIAVGGYDGGFVLSVFNYPQGGNPTLQCLTQTRLWCRRFRRCIALSSQVKAVDNEASSS